MHIMFRGATSFNQSLSNWNTGSVTSMSEMFRDTSSFNKDISDWNVSSVTDMFYMFKMQLHSTNQLEIGMYHRLQQ